MEPLQGFGFQFELGPEGMGQKILPVQPRIRFKHRSRPLLLQLAQDAFTVNVLAPYPGWETMRNDVVSSWEQAGEVLQPASIARIGLRYINKIRKNSSQERPSAWLQPSPFIPAGVLDSLSGFLLRIQVRSDPQNLSIITLAEQEPSPEAKHGYVILDIDRIVEGTVSTTPVALGAEIDKLHEDVWKVFSGAKGRALESLLGGAG